VTTNKHLELGMKWVINIPSHYVWYKVFHDLWALLQEVTS
jgi:hypothetical protein